MATRSLEINNKTVFPQQIHTWNIERKGNLIIATSSSGACSKPFFKFPYREGTLFFYNGTENAYAYFQEKKFQEWLTENNISKIVRENPNRVYSGENCNSGWGSKYFTIITDGKMKQERTGGRFDGREDVGNACYSSYETVTVTDASWVIEQRGDYYRDNRSSANILYTEVKDIYSIDFKKES